MPEALRPARARVAQAALADEDEKRCACPGVTCVFMNDGRETAGSPSFRFGPLPPDGTIFPEICGSEIWISSGVCLLTFAPWPSGNRPMAMPSRDGSEPGSVLFFFFLTNLRTEDEVLSRCQEHYNTVPTTV